jgi:hypothetical protein
VTKAERPREEPWLTREAAAQIIGNRGTLGPLFTGVELGGPAPSSAVRGRISAFARANHVTIDLETAEDQLVAVRFDVTFSGGFGYEGADVLALRLERPSSGRCCVCGEDTWINQWFVESEDGVHMTARVRVNRVSVRWERTASLSEVLQRAEAIVGWSAQSVRDAAGDRWREIEAGLYRLDVPYAFGYVSLGMGMSLPSDLAGMKVAVENERVAEVSLALYGGENAYQLRKLLRSRWGRPATNRDQTWTWRTGVQTMTAKLWEYPSTVTIRTRR